MAHRRGWWWRRRQSGERGMTVIEMTMTVALLSVVLGILFTVLVSVQNNLVRQTSRSNSNDQVRLAVEQLDREIRSGNVLYDPSAESDPTHYIFPGMSLRIYTQANATTRATSGAAGSRCVQWRIKYDLARKNYELQRREWVQDSTTSTDWRVVADHLTNRESPTKPAFAVDPARRIVNVSLVANDNTRNGSNAQVDTTIEGRNTIYGYPNTVCANVATYPTPDPPES
jgi:type II secretory pathway pseudopilin PulG